MRNCAFMTSMLLTVSAMSMQGAEFTFDGQKHDVISVTPDNRSGLDALYVVYDIAEISSMRISGVPVSATVSRYSNLGGGYAEDVTTRIDNGTLVVDNPQGNMGYIVTDNGKNSCIWIVDYKSEPMQLKSVGADSQQDCDNTRLVIDGSAPAIHYYSIDGRPVELSREIEISYSSQTWDENSNDYTTETTSQTVSYLTNPLTLVPALNYSTEVTVRGDQFLERWGMGIQVTSGTIQPNGLEVRTSAEQTNLPEFDEDTGSNMVNGDSGGDGLGGSAPAIIRFTAHCTEAVIHDEWQISFSPEFENPEYRFTEREIEYTFEEEGTYYVRYVGSNASGSCDVYGDTYTVNIGASELRIPNAFTPNDDGVNDVWKVGYRSLLDFKCWIFDRYGNEIYRFSDPSQGWDGKYKGKKVKPGVYFYVIEAKGSDGKKYKKGGDINILEYKRYGNSGGVTE